MSRFDYNLITTVIGWDLKSTVTTIVNSDGSEKKYTGGIKSTVSVCEPQPIQSRMYNQKWWTDFNTDLLEKIRDYQKNNL